MPGLDPAWSVRPILAAVAAVGLLAVLAPTAVAAAPDECVPADRLLDAGTLAQVRQADAAYRQILATSPDSVCARTGDQVATSLITAVDLHRAGLDDSVPPHIARALELRPQTRIPDELATHRAPWQSEAWLTWQDRVVLALAAAILLALAWRLLLWARWWFGRGRHGGRLLIGTFSTADGTPGGGFAAVVGDHVQRLSDYRSGQRPDRVSKWGDPVAVPAELATAVPPVGLVNAILDLVGRAGQGSDRMLGGTLHRAGEGVVGVSLTLETRQSRVVDGCGVWAGAYGLPFPQRPPAADRPEVLYPLAFPVAVWAFWKLAPDAWRLGTREWQSYALFGMGEDFDANGQMVEAERCYLRALAIDRDNTPARLNLASMWLMASTGAPAGASGEAGAVLAGRDAVTWAERELDRIQQVAAQGRERPGGGWEPDSSWYRAQYVLAATASRRQLETWGEGPLPGPWGPIAEHAVELTEDLVEHVETALADRTTASGRPAGGRRDVTDEAFTCFLEEIEASALILWAGVDLLRRVANPGPAPDPALRLRLDDVALTGPAVLAACDSGRLRMPARARYGLACYHAVAAMAARRTGESAQEHEDAALLQLQLAVPSLIRSTVENAAHDVCFRELRHDRRFADIIGSAG
ncbi:MAG TPA: hypothetical protein VOB72_14045 [Candidatus Dormibacteraeota bacterium]|nr:hypothetical protein [Candidatus Dormibacteraeota bacterium]